MDNKIKEGPLITVFNYFMWFFMANLYFLICNIPLIVIIMIFNGEWSYEYIVLFTLALIPVGPAFTALLTVMDMLIRDKYITVTKDYFKAYLENFKKSLLCWIINLLVLGILIVDIIYFTSTILWSLFIIIFILMIGLSFMIYPILVRYKINLKKIWSIAFVYSIKKINITLAIILMTITSFILLYKLTLISIYVVFSIGAYLMMKLVSSLLEEVNTIIN